MNVLRRKLAEKQLLVGALISDPTPMQIEICGHLGFDWVMIDGEHEPLTAADCQEFSRAAQLTGTALVARVPRPELIQSFAESGADAVLVPHVATRQAAEDAVSALRFPPYGTRGLHSATRAARYGLAQTAPEFFSDVENGPIAAAMIEDAEALADLPGLAAVDGMEVYFVGPSDLSGSLGHPGDPGHPEVAAALDSALRALSADPGNVVAYLAHDEAQVAQAIERGVRMVHTSTLRHYVGALRGYLDTARAVDTDLGRR